MRAIKERRGVTDAMQQAFVKCIYCSSAGFKDGKFSRLLRQQLVELHLRVGGRLQQPLRCTQRPLYRSRTGIHCCMQHVGIQVGKTLQLIVPAGHEGAQCRGVGLQPVVRQEQLHVVGRVGHALKTEMRC